MPYCTQQDLIDQFSEEELIQLTDRTGAGVIDATVLNRAIDRAASETDDYCRGRYLLPLNPVDESVLGINCDLSRYYLYDDQAADQVAKRYDQAMAKLRDIATGKLRLSAALVVSGSSVGSPQFVSEGRVFSRDSLKDF